MERQRARARAASKFRMDSGGRVLRQADRVPRLRHPHARRHGPVRSTSRARRRRSSTRRRGRRRARPHALLRRVGRPGRRQGRARRRERHVRRRGHAEDPAGGVRPQGTAEDREATRRRQGDGGGRRHGALAGDVEPLRHPSHACRAAAGCSGRTCSRRARSSTPTRRASTSRTTSR